MFPSLPVLPTASSTSFLCSCIEDNEGGLREWRDEGDIKLGASSGGGSDGVKGDMSCGGTIGELLD